MSDNKNNQALFLVTYKDGTHFVGGRSYYHTRWLEIAHKPIQRIVYKLPDGNAIVLKDYDEYFHMVEVTQDWACSGGKVRSSKVRLEYAYIMGKKSDKVVSYRRTLWETEKTKYKIGDIVRREFDINHPKIKGLNPLSWRPLK